MNIAAKGKNTDLTLRLNVHIADISDYVFMSLCQLCRFVASMN